MMGCSLIQQPQLLHNRRWGSIFSTSGSSTNCCFLSFSLGHLGRRGKGGNVIGEGARLKLVPLLLPLGSGRMGRSMDAFARAVSVGFTTSGLVGSLAGTSRDCTGLPTE